MILKFTYKGKETGIDKIILKQKKKLGGFTNSRLTVKLQY